MQCTLHMPHLTPLRDPIVGPYKDSKVCTMYVVQGGKDFFSRQWWSLQKLAKRAVALRACEMLHKCGELTDDLRPNRKVPADCEDDDEDGEDGEDDADKKKLLSSTSKK